MVNQCVGSLFFVSVAPSQHLSPQPRHWQVRGRARVLFWAGMGEQLRVHLQTQQPVVIPGAGEPEPDAAIVALPLTATEKPRAEHITCVIEVAGTSLERDRTIKLRHYARGGIGQYVILDLHQRAAEEYLEPDRDAGTYATRIAHPSDARIQLRLMGGEDLEVALTALFPVA